MPAASAVPRRAGVARTTTAPAPNRSTSRPSSDNSPDRWPSALVREVALRCSVMEPAIDACVRGELLAVLPVELIRGLGLSSGLRSLPVDCVPPTQLFALRRTPASSREGGTDLLYQQIVGRERRAHTAV